VATVGAAAGCAAAGRAATASAAAARTAAADCGTAGRATTGWATTGCGADVRAAGDGTRMFGVAGPWPTVRRPGTQPGVCASGRAWTVGVALGVAAGAPETVRTTEDRCAGVCVGPAAGTSRAAARSEAARSASRISRRVRGGGDAWPRSTTPTSSAHGRPSDSSTDEGQGLLSSATSPTRCAVVQGPHRRRRSRNHNGSWPRFQAPGQMSSLSPASGFIERARRHAGRHAGSPGCHVTFTRRHAVAKRQNRHHPQVRPNL
jgi:hypothetical protein